MRLAIAGLAVLLLLATAEAAQAACGSCEAKHDCSCKSARCGDCVAAAADCTVKSVHKACQCIEVEQDGCIGIPYTDEGCWKIDPECCPRADYCLVCPARAEFQLLCRKDCDKPCSKRRCKQDICNTCSEYDADGWE